MRDKMNNKEKMESPSASMRSEGYPHVETIQKVH